MPGLIADATPVWDVNIYWPLKSQCGVWNDKSRGVDVWECIRPHYSSADKEPRRAVEYWRYIALR